MLLTTRAHIAEAASLVEGITGSEFRPAVLAPGACWPLIASLDAVKAGYVTSWRILVVLSADERTAADQLTRWAPDLVQALGSTAWVESMAPVTIQTSAGEIPGLQITARSD